MEILSLREHPQRLHEILAYIKDKWASEQSKVVYDDCLQHTLNTDSPLPQWYVLEHEGRFVGCAGLITNDFISRMDLYPWVCSLYIEKDYRGQRLGESLLNRAKEDAYKAGFKNVFLCTDHVGFYEKFGFEFIGIGYHPWGASSRIYQALK